MKRIIILVSVLFVSLASAAWAQQQGNQNQNGQGGTTRTVYYDTFSTQWLDPAKWAAGGPDCATGLTMECVREIQNGRLRLAIRELGYAHADSGFQWGISNLDFLNPNTIRSITADVAVNSVHVSGCSTNTEQQTFTIVRVSGIWFNTGSGNDADNVSDEVDFWVDTTNPKTMSVFNWMTGNGLGVRTDIGSYPIGTPLTVTNFWDRANRQFVSVVKVKGGDGSGTRVVAPYSVDDSMPPTVFWTSLHADAYAANCSSAQASSQVEAFFDNVMVNVPPPPAE